MFCVCVKVEFMVVLEICSCIDLCGFFNWLMWECCGYDWFWMLSRFDGVGVGLGLNVVYFNYMWGLEFFKEDEKWMELSVEGVFG